MKVGETGEKSLSFVIVLTILLFSIFYVGGQVLGALGAYNGGAHSRMAKGKAKEELGPGLA